jgi:hypothetical protein
MKILISESQLKTIVNEQDSWAAALTKEYYKRFNSELNKNANEAVGARTGVSELYKSNAFNTPVLS